MTLSASRRKRERNLSNCDVDRKMEANFAKEHLKVHLHKIVVPLFKDAKRGYQDNDI